MTLAEVEQGDAFEIASIPDREIRAQAVRFGISEGAEVSCAEKIPGGPVILKQNLQEIAVGRRLAEQVEII
ncbi:FeoA family protein [Halanaerobaculum tunisiense]